MTFKTPNSTENNNINYEEKTIIGVETDSYTGEKMIHLYGYGYYAETADDNGKDFRFVEYTWFIMPLKEVKEMGFAKCESECGCEYKQYIADCTEEEMNHYYETYDNGKMPKFISEDQINELTPDGVYIIDSYVKAADGN